MTHGLNIAVLLAETEEGETGFEVFKPEDSIINVRGEVADEKLSCGIAVHLGVCGGVEKLTELVATAVGPGTLDFSASEQGLDVGPEGI